MDMHNHRAGINAALSGVPVNVEDLRVLSDRDAGRMKQKPYFD